MCPLSRNNKLWICMEYCGGQSMQDIYLCKFFFWRPNEFFHPDQTHGNPWRKIALPLSPVKHYKASVLCMKEDESIVISRCQLHLGANILLTDDGRVKVADFGVAAQLNNTIGKRTTLIGTPYWMAPEVASIESRGAGYDGKCDVWGVGITAIEYAELQPPMFDLDPRKALQILGSRNYRSPSLQDRHKWSQRFHSFVKCCLIKHERRRPDAATMLTHNFVTNPSLSPKLTQRLLNFKRQLELQAKQPLQSASPPPPVPPPLTDVVISKLPLSNVPQNGFFGLSEDSGPYPSDSPMVIPVDAQASSVVHTHQPLQQFVSTRRVLLSNDSRLLSNAQFQDSLSQSNLQVEPTECSTASSDIFSSECPPNPREVIVLADPSKAIVTNGSPQAQHSSSNLSESNSDLAPAIPARCLRGASMDTSNSEDRFSSIPENSESTCSVSVGDKQKPKRPAPPPSVIRINCNPPSSVAPLKVGGDASLPGGLGVGDGGLFADGLLRGSSEDLLREVMDAFEKRRSCIELPDSYSHAPYDRDRPSSVGASPNVSPDKQGVLTDSRRRMHPSRVQDSPTSVGVIPPRARSKRRAPPPPISESMTAEQSSTLTDSYVYQTVETAPDRQLPSIYSASPANTDQVRMEDTGTDQRSSNLVIRYERSYEPPNGAVHTSTPTEIPPRPPPPKIDTSRSILTRPLPGEEEKRAARKQLLEMGLGLPPTPKVLMGACFMLLFEGCPLKVNATATWVNPETRSQVILFGTNDGIYFLNLVDLADCTLELLIARPCGWLSVLKDTMMSLCGQPPRLYSHNLISLMKSKGHTQPKFLQKRFQPTTKIPNTRGCHIANVIRNPYNGMKYLCGAIDKSIFVMEWYNPRSTFIEVKRVAVPNMPSPVLNFDLIICQDQPLPLVCLGVFATPDPLCYKLHLVNLNDGGVESSTNSPLNHEDQLQVIKVVQLEYNTLLICFPTHATIVNLNGMVKVDRQGWKAELQFGASIHSIVCLQDSVLAFHTHGLRGIGFDGQLTQDINDDKHIYRLLGCDKNVVVESRPTDDPMSNSNIYLLAGHKDLY
ncbi:hypothetical protein T265_09813 [Opisthorchis viverrini]|uniref:Mitogen-activated protein kinase kinase kinase kinase n=1 Tax=Opisthorchis viverrini TaxID=6198 RepID=A0A074Z8S1_OPIVI|nr:hypothetical protein T265_09813 [Opisthorchis viverrini]KER21982.1 hypothetical protein T265_09813 [Opisthorchis viverrini]